jgi:hypothetical protein
MRLLTLKEESLKRVHRLVQLNKVPISRRVALSQIKNRGPPDAVSLDSSKKNSIEHEGIFSNKFIKYIWN